LYNFSFQWDRRGTLATDFRSGRDFPRRARERYGGFDYLLRVFDKGRASKAGTIFDYMYPCPIDQDIFAQWEITPDEFTAAVETCTTDEQILAWLQARVPAERRDATNAYLASTWTHKMDKHDRDENAVAHA
jgi:hypothetical protein